MKADRNTGENTVPRIAHMSSSAECNKETIITQTTDR
jgi:hypothetical protein